MQPVSLPRNVKPSSLQSAPDWALRALHRQMQGESRPTDRLWIDPGYLMRRAGANPDQWQTRLLQSRAREVMLCCSRQVGKSTTTAALTLNAAILEAPALVLVVCPSERQSSEFLHKVQAFYAAMTRQVSVTGRPQTLHQTMLESAGSDDAYIRIPAKERESSLQLHLKNGSRIIGLPGSEKTIRGYSGVSLLVIDEAARVEDALYSSVRPMMATSKGRIIALSTPFGKRGWFYKEFMDSTREWERITVRAGECPRIPPQFLAEERRTLGERWYRQEYECSFEDTIDSVFSATDIQAAARAGDNLEPLTW